MKVLDCPVLANLEARSDRETIISMKSYLYGLERAIDYLQYFRKDQIMSMHDYMLENLVNDIEEQDLDLTPRPQVKKQSQNPLLAHLELETFKEELWYVKGYLKGIESALEAAHTMIGFRLEAKHREMVEYLEFRVKEELSSEQ